MVPSLSSFPVSHNVQFSTKSKQTQEMRHQHGKQEKQQCREADSGLLEFSDTEFKRAVTNIFREIKEV